MLPAACDRATAQVCSEGGARYPGLTLFATILASSLAFIDGSVVNVALPAIGRNYGASPDELQWTLNAYLLPLSALLLLGGAAGDHFGRRRLLIGGIAMFTLASIGCALAPTIELLLAGRALQGVGAAMLMPNSLAILGNAFTGERKGRAIGTWAAAGAIAGAVGPPLGGWLVDAVGWQAIFYINLPVALVAIVIAWRYVEESKPGERPLDWPGAALATLALGGLTYGLTLWSGAQAMSGSIAIALGVGTALLAAFLLVEHRRGERAMMPLDLFGSRAFVGLTALTFLLYSALGGLLVLLPYVLIEAAGYSPLDAGLALLPFALVIGLASRTMGRLTERIGPRLPLTIGPIVTAIGFALLTRVAAGADYWTNVFPAMLVIALGMAGAVAPLTAAVLSSVDDSHAGTASGFNSAIARTGGLIATALAGGVIAQSGAGLIAAFHGAALIGAGFAVLSGVTAWATLGMIARDR